MHLRSATALPTFIHLSSAVPKQSFDQDTLWEETFDTWYADIPDARELGTVTRVRKRHMAWNPATDVGDRTRGIGERMEAYVGVVDEVAGEAVEHLLRPIDRQEVGSIIMAGSSGYYGPTPEYFLAKRFGLKSSVRRTHIGHMGCFAAFNVIKAAMDSVMPAPMNTPSAYARSSAVCTSVRKPHASKPSSITCSAMRLGLSRWG